MHAAFVACCTGPRSGSFGRRLRSPLIRFAMVGCCSSRPVDPQEDTLSREARMSKLRSRATKCSPALNLGAPLDTFQEGTVLGMYLKGV
jgi:hypothetical protein